MEKCYKNWTWKVLIFIQIEEEKKTETALFNENISETRRQQFQFYYCRCFACFVNWKNSNKNDDEKRIKRNKIK